ncbi:hypothetical protein HMPREF3293_00601 [Christensenella minuta]|uniref:Uncharacterized protein n=1 Tax=Christensenella minuta TaxID=626937 RepID=A0A136Q7A5_9FIRM|nr:hypothetical protein HMPREF3293_00601 [Christensenella minuta]
MILQNTATIWIYHARGNGEQTLKMSCAQKTGQDVRGWSGIGQRLSFALRPHLRFGILSFLMYNNIQ